ncbi:hypothetical protein KV205_08215 [Streptomyces sp. SKN60]|uniref:hypothetical protein n=1 Tax=Streptomyces sp. SKN60 TaxID=2855506 RepID=UPI00224546BB|nr:hypothetical protein [Streptomyces sp. SKN60]MCX2180511.1 hypothetical protein [Streptomyces sp. SKN60]
MRLASRRAPRSAHRHALLTAAAALVLAGCATVHPHSAAPAPPVGTAGAPASALATRQAQDRLLKAAEQRLVADCLDAQGLTLPPAPVSQARAPAPAPGPAAADADTRLQTALFGRDPRELSLTLATGHTVTANSDGCVAAARAALYGDQHRWFRAQVTVDNLRAEAQARMKDDPAHRAALDRWTRCAAPSGGPRAGRPDPAVAERCTRESGLADVRARLEPAELATVRTLHRDQVATYEQLRARALRRAAELSAHPTGKTATSEKKGIDAS